ncbi:hypothetical protein ILYODFUR_038812 [Ilyodon furcidens]|uniref:Uncharacterized protein n=1 Tax=Ilyodon furcidens TaxID=33524 RepID=A0ABV0UQH5_9TELE
MEKEQSKQKNNLEGDVKFMENYVEGADMICRRWNKKHGFLGKLDTKDVLKLQGDLKLEIMKIKKTQKKEQRKVEYKLSEKWLEQSKLRDIQRQDKREKRKEKLTAAVLVRPEEETTTAFRQQRLQPPGEQPPADTQAVMQHEQEKEGAAAAPPQTPERKPDKSSNPFKTEEQSSWSPNFWGSTDVRTRSKKMKTTTDPGLYPNDALLACERKDHPSGKNIEEDTFPLVEVANPNMGNANNPQPQTILVYRTQEDRTAALKGIPPIQEGVQELLAAITELRGSFHLNGREMHQCLSQLFGHRWCRVAGDFTGNDAQGNSMAHNSAGLTDVLRILYDRIRTDYTQAADYGKISQCKQKDEEDPQDFLDRMRRVFRANSAIPYNEVEGGAYQQQLKRASVFAGIKI